MNRILVVLLCMSICQLSFGQYEGYSAERIITKAYESVEKEDYDTAIKQLGKIHRSDEAYTTAQIEIIDILMKQEKFDEVSLMFSKMKEDGYFKEQPELYINYGSFLSGKEKYDESLAVYEEAEAKYPHYDDILFNLGLVHYNAGNIQKSIDYVKKSVDLNPGYATAHYFLGVLAFENGQLAEGALAMLGFLAYNPNHQYAKNAILALNKKMAQNYLEETDFVFSEKGDKFDQLDLILRKQLPLNDKYKLNCKIDEVYTRHAQATLEYASSHTIGDGFFERTYIPFLADIDKNGHTENFIYYTLGGLKDLEKQVKKQEKKVTKFYESYFVPKFWYNFAGRKRMVAGEMRDVVVFSENGTPTMAVEMKGTEQHGKGEFFDKYGRVTGSVTFVDDEADGIVTYYDGDGNKTEEITFENGVKNGPQTIFFDSGEKYSVWTNVDGEMTGDYITYYKDGSIFCKSTMLNGEFDQYSSCNYASGKKKFELTYDKGKVNGVRTNYFKNGALKSKETLKQNLFEGPTTYYRLNGEKKFEINYAGDEVSENYTLKDNLGEVTYEYIIDGKKTITKEYVGGLLDQVIMSENDEIKYLESYSDGMKYVRQTFKDGKTKDVFQFTKGDDKGKKLKVENHKLHDVYGNFVSERKYKNGLIDGENNYYYLNGKKSSQMNFVDGKETGVSKFYDIEGRLKTEYEIRNDSLNGYYLNYDDGILSSFYSYENGKLNGAGYGYHKNGKISLDSYYKDDSPVGVFIYYDQDGIVYQKDTYKEGEHVLSQFYDKKGKMIFDVDYENTNGKVVKQLSTNKEIISFSVRNKTLDGKYEAVDASGDSIFIFNYESGSRYGRSVYYSGANKITFDGYYTDNLQDGLCKYYDDLNVLRVTSMFAEDEENGEEVRFAKNGGKIASWANRKDNIIGEKQIFNSEGTLLMSLDYIQNVPLRYKAMNDSEWIDLGLDKKTIEVKYENGQTALEISFKNRLLDGKYVIFLENGNQVCELNYKEGMLHGKSTYNHEDGSPYRTMIHEDDIRQGAVEYFDEEGRPLLKFGYKDDMVHGAYEIYENGKLIKTKTYHYNDVIEIK